MKDLKRNSVNPLYNNKLIVMKKHIPKEIYKWQDKFFKRMVDYYSNIYFRSEDKRNYLLKAYKWKRRLKRALKKDKVWKNELLKTQDAYCCMYKWILRLF